MKACDNNNITLVNLLIKNKVNIEHRTKGGLTGFIISCLKNYEKVAKVLLENKINKE